MDKSTFEEVSTLEERMFSENYHVHNETRVPVIITTNLSGHSGCNIAKIESSGSKLPYVRKTSASKEYNSRLAKQMKKQKEFRRNGIKTPRIMNVGYTDSGLLYFDMEYVAGKRLSEYIKDHSVTDIESIIDKLMTYKHPKRESVDNKALIKAKLASLKATLNEYENSSPCRMALNALEKFDFVLHSSECHGDLTFENIIVTEEKDVYLIDFLDSFIDCYEIDVSKLLQDAFCGWTYRFEKLNDETVRKLDDIERYIKKAYEVKTSSESCSSLQAMLLLTLLRIYPYTHDKETVAFLDEKILQILEEGV